MELSKEKLIELGGKFWEKGNMERVYFDDGLYSKVFDLKLTDSPKWANESKPLRRSKLYFNCKKQTLHCDEGRVRTTLAVLGFNCFK